MTPNGRRESPWSRPARSLKADARNVNTDGSLNNNNAYNGNNGVRPDLVENGTD